jgi:hypothetical protein
VSDRLAVLTAGFAIASMIFAVWVYARWGRA